MTAYQGEPVGGSPQDRVRSAFMQAEQREETKRTTLAINVKLLIRRLYNCPPVLFCEKGSTVGNPRSSLTPKRMRPAEIG